MPLSLGFIVVGCQWSWGMRWGASEERSISWSQGRAWPNTVTHGRHVWSRRYSRLPFAGKWL